MGERTLAQSMAAENWQHLKAQVRYWRSWKYTPSSHPRAYAAWAAEMRNAWAAYHAGARWMHPSCALVMGRRSGKTLLAENARLRAEVERLRSAMQLAREEACCAGPVNILRDALAREDGAS